MPRTRKKVQKRTKSQRATLLLKGVKFNFCHLLKPDYDMDDRLKYMVTLSMPEDHEQANVLYDTIEDLISKAWPNGDPPNLQPTIKEGVQYNWLDDDEIAISCRNVYDDDDPEKNRPTIVDAKRMPIVSSRDLYSGCFGNASINLYTYDKAGNQGVAVSINGVQVTLKGERLDGADRDPMSMFEEEDGFSVSPEAGFLDEDADEDEDEEPTPKRRGRRKAAAVEHEDEEPTPKRRGRRKAAAVEDEDEEPTPKRRGRRKAAAVEDEDEEPTPKRRGRRKAKPEPTVAEDPDDDIFDEDDLI